MPEILFVSLRTGDIGPDVSEAEFGDVLGASELRQHDIEMRVLADTDATIGSVDGFAGVIVGGSSLNASNPSYSEWQSHVHTELAGLIATGVPVLFICFGLSWLVTELGGTSDHSHPEVSGPTVVELTEAGKYDPLLRGFPESFTALTGHTENPELLSEDVEVLATGPTCPIQIVRYRDNVWAAQFHPEMDATAMRTRMNFFFDYGYFPLTEYDTIVAALPSVDTTWSRALVRRFVEHSRSLQR